MSDLMTTLCRFFMFGFFWIIGLGQLEATTYIVTNSSDSGPGSLRQAIDDANLNPGKDTVDIMTSLDTILLTTHHDTFEINHLYITDSVIILGNDITLTTQDSGRFFQNTVFAEFSEVTFFQGKAKSSFGNAGAFWCVDGDFIDCRFIENSAANTGGAILINGFPDTAIVNFYGCLFENNHSGVEGGALFIRVAKVLFQDCCFMNNTSAGTAPHIKNNQGIVTFRGIYKFTGDTPHIVSGTSSELILASSFTVPLGTEFVLE